ncbi:MAG: TonB-dependent receptor [Nitrosomonas sp.]|nr:TonB-dependent receptor [Nitrosomonas sp.]
MEEAAKLVASLRWIFACCMLYLLICSQMTANAAGAPSLKKMTVHANAWELTDSADSANEGTVLKQQLDLSTAYRPGELLGTVPGLAVTQHSGEGKANQYFLRGFNLDHDTDLRITVDGMLVSQRSHEHGQGWADTNFIIPGLIRNIQYLKGPYYTEQAGKDTTIKRKIRFADTASQDIMRSAKSEKKPGIDKASEESVVKLKEITVRGRERATRLVGETQSASQGFIGQEQIKNRPLLRVGEVVEFIPGMIATQHSGDGKANQYFLRGFNLDHGTDFATFVDGVPINLPSHAHGQGYMDLNGLIPELIDNVQYGKGPYYADQGDFSSAGHAKITTFNSLPQGFAKFTGGSFGFYRGVVAHSNRIGDGHLLYAGDVNAYDGPWVLAQNALKFNGMIKYSLDQGNWGISVGVNAYHADWRATNQIPLFAVNEGLINRFGNVDPTDNGKTRRYTLNGTWWQKEKSYQREATFYLAKYDFDLFSNFSGFINSASQNIMLAGGVVPSDQVNQTESRIYFGGKIEQTLFNKVAGFDMQNTLGIQVRNDLNHVLLNNSNRGVVYNNVSNDQVTVTSIGLYLQNQTYWLPKLKTIAGLRGDIFNFGVHAFTIPQNSGNKTDALVSPKLSVILGPWYDSEIYLNFGEGYHSNDARGVNAIVANANQIGNNNFAPQLGATGLVRAKGAEVGFRTEAIKGLKSTLAFWYLQSASELVFSGDTGTTETSGASTRYGIEWANFYKPFSWLTLDADFSFTRARYDQAQLNQASDPANQAYGFHIPNAVGRTINTGATLNLPHNIFATLRLRHFGNVTVDTNNPVAPYNTTIVNFSTGYEVRKFKLQFDILNLFNARAYDIGYYYGYQTSPTSIAKDGIVFHPTEPRMFRASLVYQF